MEEETVSGSNSVETVETQETGVSNSDSETSDDENEEVHVVKKQKVNTKVKAFQPAIQKILDVSDDEVDLNEMFKIKDRQFKDDLKVRQLTEFRNTMESFLKCGLDPSSPVIQDLMKKIMGLVDIISTSESLPESSKKQQ